MKQNKGFTILELLIATTIFSVILLLVTAGLIYAGKVYYRTVIQNKAQESTRSIIDDVARAIQFSGGEVSFDGDATCIGGVMYKKVTNTFVNESLTNGLVRGNFSGVCNASATLTNTTQLVPQGMFLRDFAVTSLPANDVYSIAVHVVSVPGDETINSDGSTSDLFNGTNCRGGAGSEYCASSSLETTVKKRIQ